jgi:hypothetical protein
LNEVLNVGVGTHCTVEFGGVALPGRCSGPRTGTRGRVTGWCGFRDVTVDDG